jgi:hypothetical protein
MHRLTSILFQVGACDAKAAGALWGVYLDVPAAADGDVVLRYLVALGQVGVEVLLAVKL